MTSLPVWQASDSVVEGGLIGAATWHLLAGNETIVTLHPFPPAPREAGREQFNRPYWVSDFSVPWDSGFVFSWDCVEFFNLADAKAFFMDWFIQTANSQQ